VTRKPDADPDEDPIVGDAEGISIGEGDQFDYELSRPGGGEFGFDASEIPELVDLLEHMHGDG
jgi:hypothetical protein